MNNVSGRGAPPAVRAEGVRALRVGREVLHGLAFEVQRGLVTGLLGPSGSGKTTLMRAVVGVQRNVTGTLEVLGEPAGSPALRRRVAYMTQSPSVYPDLTARQNLRFFADVLGTTRGDIERAIDAVDLADLADVLVSRMSGGERSRVSLAVALLGEPELLVLDEPTVGLDPVLRRDLWALFHRLAAGGASLLVSSHVMDEAERCDRLLLVRDGDLVFSGKTADLLATTGTEDVEHAFLRLVEGGNR